MKLADKDTDQVLNKLKQLHVARIANGGKPSIVLADSTDLGSKLESLTVRVGDLITKATNDKTIGESLSKLEQLANSIDEFNETIVQLRSALDSVDNTDVVEALNSLANLIESKEYNPTITVEAPKVKIPKIELPEVKEKTNLLEYKAQDLKEPVDGVQYVGFVNPNGDWYIQHNDEESGTVRYVFGSGNYQDAFRKRESFEYKTLDIAISEWRDEA